MPHPPPPSIGWALRWGRACVLSAVALALATGSHTTAGGGVPDAGALALLTGVSTAAAAVVLGRPVSRARALVLVLGWQGLLHAGLSAHHGHGAPAGTSASIPALGLHLLAGLLVGLWLAAGERALWCLLKELGTSLTAAARPLQRPAAACARPDRPAPAYARRRRPGLLHGRLGRRRGPPVTT